MSKLQTTLETRCPDTIQLPRSLDSLTYSLLNYIDFIPLLCVPSLCHNIILAVLHKQECCLAGESSAPKHTWDVGWLLMYSFEISLCGYLFVAPFKRH